MWDWINIVIETLLILCAGWWIYWFIIIAFCTLKHIFYDSDPEIDLTEWVNARSQPRVWIRTLKQFFSKE